MSDVTLEMLDEKQREAVEMCLDMTRRCVAVTGEAGSGKTTIIQFVYQSLTDAGYNVAVCAPTGKAAKRIREATGIPAQTVHKLLEFTAPTDIDPKTGKPYGKTIPRRDAVDKLTYDAIIGDEYAMMSRDLHRCVVEAMPTGSRLLVFGDDQQLPPIEENGKTEYVNGKPISAFGKIVAKFGIRLARSHRQAEGSDVLFNAHRIRSGMMVQAREKFRVITSDDIVTQVLKTCGQFDIAAMNNQVITPSNRTWIGTQALNNAVQSFLWAERDTQPHYKPRRWKNEHTGKGAPEIVLGIGDKVIVTRNSYDIECSDGTFGVFNGEMGIVQDITPNEDIIIDLGDRIATMPYALEVSVEGRVFINYPHRDIDLGYVITTHKAQGSEFNNVIVVLGRSVFGMLNRRNLYTAVTRARDSVHIVTDKTGLTTAIKQAEPKEW
jgi:exodeoxyribonuclease V alpha subunit